MLHSLITLVQKPCDSILTFHNCRSLDTKFSFFIWTKLVTILNINYLGKKKIYDGLQAINLISDLTYKQGERVDSSKPFVSFNSFAF